MDEEELMMSGDFLVSPQEAQLMSMDPAAALPPAQMMSVSTDPVAPGNVFDQAESMGPNPGRDPMAPVDSFAPDPRLDPITNQFAQAKWMRDRGMVYDPGQAAVQEAWIPQSRTGAMPDFFKPERDNLYDRERGLVRDQEAIQYSENDIAREAARRRELEAKRQLMDQEAEMEAITREVNTMRDQLNRDREYQRRLLSDGLSPYKALAANGSEGLGRLTAAVSMAMAAGTGDPNQMQMLSKNIDSIIGQEVRSQMLQLDLAGEQANNTYKMLLDRYQDKGLAQSALRSLLQEAAKAEIASMSLQNADPQTALASQQAQLELDKKQLAEDDAFAARAHGQLTERFQQARAGRAGGWRMDLDKWQDWVTKEARRGETAAKTAGQWQEVMGNQPGVQNTQELEKAFQSIPASIKKDLVDHENMVSMVDRVAKVIGAEGFDPVSGKIVGLDRAQREGDMPGFGAWDRLKYRATGGMLSDDKEDEVIRIRQELENMIVRARAGANLTGGEIKREAGIRQAFESGDDVEAFRLLGEELADQRNNMASTLLSPGQRAALEWSRRGFQQNTGVRSPGQGMSSSVPGAVPRGRL